MLPKRRRRRTWMDVMIPNVLRGVLIVATDLFTACGLNAEARPTARYNRTAMPTPNTLRKAHCLTPTERDCYQAAWNEMDNFELARGGIVRAVPS